MGEPVRSGASARHASCPLFGEDDLRAAEKLLAALAIAVALFCMARLDIGLSELFYRPGAGFTWDPHGPLEFVRAFLPTMILGSLLFFTLVWIAGPFSGGWLWNISTKHIVYLLTTVVIGPGLICEVLLKPHWGRARPKDLTLFGGHAIYTPPFALAHECTRNCSFVSGHAAIAFWVTAYAFLLPARWRAIGLWAGGLFGLAVGLVRVVQGAHFPSDVLAAGLIVVGVNIAFARFILGRR